MDLKKKKSDDYKNNEKGKSGDHKKNPDEDRYREYQDEMIRIRKEYESIKEKLTKINRISHELEVAKKDFLKIISHEVRTPLNGILGSLQLMKLDLSDDSDNALFNILNNSAIRLEKFCLDALLFTNLRLGERKLNFKSLNIQNVLEKAINDNMTALANKKIEIVQEPGFTSVVYADEELLSRCFSEVIDNSIINSPANSIINVAVKSDKRRVGIKFKDHGRGFSDKAINNLFKTFTIDQEFVDKNIGLGLSLVKYIIAEHDGNIEITNHENGALVTLYLPMRRARGSGTGEISE